MRPARATISSACSRKVAVTASCPSISAPQAEVDLDLLAALVEQRERFKRENLLEARGRRSAAARQNHWRGRRRLRRRGRRPLPAPQRGVGSAASLANAINLLELSEEDHESEMMTIVNLLVVGSIALGLLPHLHAPQPGVPSLLSDW